MQQSISEAKLFVVGAGGIGCELLKNLVLCGFRNIQVIDLDIIDVSNLNRQFLFQKKHVGLSKAEVAKESVLKLCPAAHITALHDTIFNPLYNMQFFKQFDVVLNALDNRAARNHVNRMCLAADIPLVESGSAGYLGQVTVIKKGLTECYECTPAPRQKTFPGCTIRNTPSELIHCIVWAKYLFNQLFGEEDADQDVSPDAEDPEARAGESGDLTLQKQNILIQRKSTRTWAKECDYDAAKIFNKLFCADIKYLLSMDKLWKKRKPPQPLSYEDAQGNVPSSENQETTSEFQHVLGVQENSTLFKESIDVLKQELKGEGDGGILVWDKDNDSAMNFVSSAANIRAHIFDIKQKSRFEVKSMAGNIIPAIATTNAIVAGLIVMQALCIIKKEIEKCRSVFVCKTANASKKLLIPCSLDPPKPDCYVCAEKPEITIKLDTSTLTVMEFRDKILKANLGMLAPDVEILDGRATILISSEEEEINEDVLTRPLNDFNICHGSRLRADDFLQNYDIIVNILHGEDFDSEDTFEVVSKSGNVSAQNNPTENEQPTTEKASTSKQESDDEVMIVDDVRSEIGNSKYIKRKHSSTEDNSNGTIESGKTAPKKQKLMISGNNKHGDDTSDVVEVL